MYIRQIHPERILLQTVATSPQYHFLFHYLTHSRHNRTLGQDLVLTNLTHQI
jgi:hypothetical protein